MSTRDNLDKILKRVESGLSTYQDAEWLRWYFETLKAEIELLIEQRNEAREKLGRKP